MKIFLKVIALIVASFLFSLYLTTLGTPLVWNLMYFIPFFIIGGVPVNLLIERLVKNSWVQYTCYIIIGITVSLLIGHLTFNIASAPGYVSILMNYIMLGIIASVLFTIAIIIANRTNGKNS